jgi:hypothetical protein
MSARIGLDLSLLMKMFGDLESWCGISASCAGAVIGCPARLALPQVKTSGSFADRGNVIHEFARVVRKNPDARGQALLEIDDDDIRRTCDNLNVDDALVGIEDCQYELAYALDAKNRTVRFIGENIHRKYNEVLVARGEKPLGRYEIPVTMDVVGWQQVNDVRVPTELDWKSGRYEEDPEAHWQRRICSTTLMIVHGTPTAISRIGYIWDDGSVHPDGHEFSCMDIDDFCDELVKGIDAVWEARALLANGIMPTLHPSDKNCQYCPAMDSCPYYLNFAKAMAGRMEEIKNLTLSTLTGDELVKVWEEAKLAAKLAEEIIEKRLKVLAREGKIIGAKHEVTPKYQPGKMRFDDSKARGLIVTLMGRMGASEEDIQAEIKKLSTKGPDYAVITKRKRQLPMAS